MPVHGELALRESETAAVGGFKSSPGDCPRQLLTASGDIGPICAARAVIWAGKAPSMPRRCRTSPSGRPRASWPRHECNGRRAARGTSPLWPGREGCMPRRCNAAEQLGYLQVAASRRSQGVPSGPAIPLRAPLGGLRREGPLGGIPRRLALRLDATIHGRSMHGARHCAPTLSDRPQRADLTPGTGGGFPSHRPWGPAASQARGDSRKDGMFDYPRKGRGGP